MFRIVPRVIRGGDSGLLTKAGQMVTYAREDVLRQEFWPIAHEVLRLARFPSEHDEKGRLQAIYDFVFGLVFVVAPPIATQYLLRPEALYERRMGDCTAFATFCAAAGGVYGFRSALVFASTIPSGEWEHVWARFFLPARSRQTFIDCDPSYRKAGAGLGWALPDAKCTRLVEVEVM